MEKKKSKMVVMQSTINYLLGKNLVNELNVMVDDEFEKVENEGKEIYYKKIL